MGALRLESKLDSVNAAALKWTNEDGVQEEITDKERLFDVNVAAHSAVVFDVVPISTQGTTKIMSCVSHRLFFLLLAHSMSLPTHFRLVLLCGATSSMRAII